MKRKLVAAAVVVVGAGLAWSAAAQVKPEILIKQRQAVMTLQGKYFGPMGAMAQGKLPYNAEVVRRNAGFLDNLSRMPWDGFDPSTKDVKDIKTAALPAIWGEPDKWRQAADRLQAETAKLYEVSRSGDEAAVKNQIAAVGKACGGCHENFRQKQ